MTESSPNIGKEILTNPQSNDVLIAGVSAFNSVFTRDKYQHIRTIAQWMRRHTRHIAFMYPDEPEQANLVALGVTDPTEIQKKIRNGFRGIMKQGKKVLEDLSVDPEKGILIWEKFREHPLYRNTYNDLQDLYTQNPQFTEDVHRTVEEVLKSKFQSPHFKDTNTATEHSLQIAKDFLLGELAFIVNAANILGRSRSAYVYHQEMPVLRKLIAGQYAGFTPPGNTGCIVVSEKREETEK